MGRRKKKKILPPAPTLPLPSTLSSQTLYSMICIPDQEYHRLLDENKELKIKVSRLEGTVLTITNDLNDKIKTNDILRQENEMLRKKIDELERTISEQNQKISEQDVRISKLEDDKIGLMCGTVLEQFKKNYIMNEYHVKGRELYRRMNDDWYATFKSHDTYAWLNQLITPSRNSLAHPTISECKIYKDRIREIFSSIIQTNKDIGEDDYKVLMNDVDVILQTTLK